MVNGCHFGSSDKVICSLLEISFFRLSENVYFKKCQILTAWSKMQQKKKCNFHFKGCSPAFSGFGLSSEFNFIPNSPNPNLTCSLAGALYSNACCVFRIFAMFSCLQET